MSKQKQLNIGLFGFGVVGESLWQVIQKNTSLNAQITRVCIKHPDKQRSAPASLFTTQPADLLNDPEINVIIELIDDAEAAYSIVSWALQLGKAVVSANKKMIAANLPALLELQQQYGTPFLYEAACCASIPVIRNLEEYYDNDLLQSVSGIINGSTNYILTRVAEDKISFEKALKQAQEAGFAESDPTLDIEGTDAANKLCILLAHAFGLVAGPTQFTSSGITAIHEEDARYAREKGLGIKLVAQATKLPSGNIAAFVLPQFVEKTNPLHHIRNEYNGVIIESGLADQQFFNGKGAGGYPTASAVLSDLSALRYNYRYEYKKLNTVQQVSLSDNFFLRLYVSTEAGENLPEDLFEHIDEWASNDRRCYVIGTVHISKLAGSDWWKQNNISVIAMPDAISTRIAKKGSRKIEELLVI